MIVKDREILRQLATRWMELATDPIMEERKRLWAAVKDLRAERPMLLFETGLLEDYVTDDELLCNDPASRGMEKTLRWGIRHAEEVGDDVVLSPYFRAGWQMHFSDYGVEVVATHGTDETGGQLGHAFTHPIQTPEDLDKLQTRTWGLNREASQRHFEQMSELFDGVMPVIFEGAKVFIPSMTSDAFRLTGNDNLLMWAYDEPEALHRLMAYIRDDRRRFHAWLEQEELLSLNNSNDTFIGGSMGFTNALPQPDYAGTARLRDLWAWVESQETLMVSPDTFAEFFLPYIADVANDFGAVYYGCCEHLHDRWPLLREAIPNIRAVSISMWSDQRKMAEYLGRDYVYSRKPKPAPMSGVTPDWDTLRDDLEATLDAAKDCNLEFIFRDVYRINGDRPRLRQWMEMARTHVGGEML